MITNKKETEASVDILDEHLKKELSTNVWFHRFIILIAVDYINPYYSLLY